MSGRDRIFQILGTSFGLAYLPIAPGTWGSLPGVAIFILISLISPEANHSFWIAAALILVCVFCLSLSPWAERYWGVKDPRRFVLDEVAGFLVTVPLFLYP